MSDNSEVSKINKNYYKRIRKNEMKNVVMQWKRKDEVRAANVRYLIYFDLRRRVLNKGLLLRNEELDFAGSD